MKSYSIPAFNEIMKTYKGNTAMIRYLFWIVGSPGYGSGLFNEMLSNHQADKPQDYFERQYPDELAIFKRHIDNDAELTEMVTKLNIK